MELQRLVLPEFDRHRTARADRPAIQPDRHRVVVRLELQRENVRVAIQRLVLVHFRASPPVHDLALHRQWRVDLDVALGEWNGAQDGENGVALPVGARRLAGDLLVGSGCALEIAAQRVVAHEHRVADLRVPSLRPAAASQAVEQCRGKRSANGGGRPLDGRLQQEGRGVAGGLGIDRQQPRDLDLLGGERVAAGIDEIVVAPGAEMAAEPQHHLVEI